ncbi:g9348 [Coccomyxa elongata]
MSSRLRSQTSLSRQYNRFQCRRSSFSIRAEQERSGNETTTEEEPLPPWIRGERERKLAAQEGSDLPFPVYLIGSALVAIAAVGSIFEFANRNPIFGVLPPDNFLWAPILLFFSITGFPSAGFLFFKAITAANKEAERQDKIDGY